MIKASLAVETGLFPPSLHYRTANPTLGLERSPLYVNTRLRRWDADRGARRAAVSSFGLGGTNAHVVLEEPPSRSPAAGNAPEAQLLVVSAATPSALDQACLRLADHLDKHPGRDLRDVAYTLQVGRRHFPWRRAFVCHDHHSAASVLRDSSAYRTWQREEPQPLLFVFDGQGASRGTAQTPTHDIHPIARGNAEDCLKALEPALAQAVRYAMNSGGGTAERRSPAAAIARFVTDYAIAQAWLALGLAPRALVGLGSGFLTAASVAGVIRPDDAMMLLTLAASDADGSRSAHAAAGNAAGLLLEKLSLSPPSVPLLDGATGELVEKIDPRMLRLLSEAEPFTGLSLARLRRERQILLQVSPGAHVCGAPPGATTAVVQALSVCSLVPQHGEGGQDGLLEAAGRLWGAGVDFTWSAFHAGTTPRLVPLPTYPFQRKRYWFSIQPAGSTAAPTNGPVIAQSDGNLLQPV